MNKTEATLLNFLKFFDKCIAQRVSTEELKIFHEKHPMTIIPIGTDSEFRCLAKTFLHFGPAYFVNNSDVKGKTQSELERMQKAKEWTTVCESGYLVEGQLKWILDLGQHDCEMWRRKAFEN